MNGLMLLCMCMCCLRPLDVLNCLPHSGHALLASCSAVRPLSDVDVLLLLDVLVPAAYADEADDDDGDDTLPKLAR